LDCDYCWVEMIVVLRVCRAHEAAALVRQTADEECDNICRLSTYFLGRVLTDWQVAVMLARAHPHSAHIMVRRIYSTIIVITTLLIITPPSNAGLAISSAGIY
jgi:hypothetical protein